MSNTITRDEGAKDNAKDIAKKVYEIGYVLLSSIAQEKVAEQTAMVNDILAKAGAVIIGHEDPVMTQLAYTMTKKIHGANHRFDEGYFGWVKFELSSDAIGQVKKAFDSAESVLRYLLMTTVRENIYLGKRAPSYTGGAVARDAGMIAPESAIMAEEASSAKPVTAPTSSASAAASVATPIPVSATVSVEEMDKGIDAMVKGV